MSKTNFARIITAFAWMSVITLGYATLAHVGFVYSIYFKLSPFLMRPDIRTYVHFEHIIAFAALGALFSFAYPRHTILVCCIVLGAAAGLEILQTLTPDRHGTLVDALEKMAGGAVGIIIARGILQFRPAGASAPQERPAANPKSL
jgi:VanZ family protein